MNLIEDKPLLGDDTNIAAMHPKKLHDFFGWDEPWAHNRPFMDPPSWLARAGLPGKR